MPPSLSGMLFAAQAALMSLQAKATIMTGAPGTEVIRTDAGSAAPPFHVADCHADPQHALTTARDAVRHSREGHAGGVANALVVVRACI